MTKLEQIKSRLEKATPGPWSTDDESINCGSDALALFSDKTSNLRFIANAPTDIEYLISQLEKAKKMANWYSNLGIPKTATHANLMGVHPVNYDGGKKALTFLDELNNA